MSTYASHLRDKQKMRLEASMARPERSRFSEEVSINNALFNMKKDMPKESDATVGMLDELQKNWDSGRKGGAGDSIISGIKAGLKQKSIVDDKERMQKHMSSLEKMQGMVQQQNQQLYQQEKLATAREALAPRVGAYLEQAKKMTPDARAMYVQRAMDEYNQLADTDYKVASVDGFEPWKVTAIDGDEAQVIDLMDFIKTPAEKKFDLYTQSPEYQQMEQQLRADDQIEKADKRTSADLNRLKADEYKDEAQQRDYYRKIESAIKNEIGDTVKAIDGLSPSLQLYANKSIDNYVEKSNKSLNAEKNLKRLAQLAKNNPEIFGTYSALAEQRFNEDNSYMNKIIRDFNIPEKSLAAINELNSLIKKINVNSLEGIPGKGMNQMLEKRLFGGDPNSNMQPEFIEKYANEFAQQFGEIHREFKKAADYGSEGFLYHPRAKKGEVSPNDAISQLQSVDPSLTPEMIQEALRRSNGGQ